MLYQAAPPLLKRSLLSHVLRWPPYHGREAAPPLLSWSHFGAGEVCVSQEKVRGSGRLFDVKERRIVKNIFLIT